MDIVKMPMDRSDQDAFGEEVEIRSDKKEEVPYAARGAFKQITEGCTSRTQHRKQTKKRSEKNLCFAQKNQAETAGETS